MKEFILVYLPWLMSCVNLMCTFLDGKKYRYSPLIKAINQINWFTWIYLSQNWGFMPLTIVVTVLYIRNHFLWTKKSPEVSMERKLDWT